MCTVTILRPHASGYRLACNRDEAVSRPAALPPRPSRFGERIAMMPVDPVSGGTWIAANDAGLAMVLMNATPDTGASTQRVSRGTIIPHFIDCADIDQAARRVVEEIDPSRHAPFRLVMTDGRRLSDIGSDGRGFRSHSRPLDLRPILFSSSGLGDWVVREPRAKLFETTLLALDVAGPELAAAQDAFHRHSWPERRHVSVCMRRAGARTVSNTIIESSADVVDMHYLADAPDSGGRAMRCRLLARRADDSRPRAAC